MSAWVAQGVHELHHLGKTLASRRYYPGTISSLLFVASIDFLFFPVWLEHLNLRSGALFNFFYGIQPILVLAFALEHAHWLKRGGRQVPVQVIGPRGPQKAELINNSR